MPKKRVKKFKLKKFIYFLFLIFIILIIIYYYLTANIRNIYIIGNDNINDNEILTATSLKSYPSFIFTTEREIKEKLLENKLIKKVKVRKSFDLKLNIEIDEYKIIAITNDNKLILENGERIDNSYNIKIYPRLINDIDAEIYNKFIKKFNFIDNDILLNISEIEYIPNEVDKQRFLLYMKDKNMVYITLTKIEKLNKYNKICEQLDNKIGIISLDSGNYIELK